MAEDINPVRRAELEAARDELEPILRGLHDDALTIVTVGLKEAFEAQIAAKQNRLDLINGELQEMDAVNVAHDLLLADGYPDMPPVLLAADLWAELQRENADREAAAAIFVSAPPPQATSLSMAFGTPEPKPVA